MSSAFVLSLQVRAFNGKPVNNLKQLATMVEDCNEEFLKFDMDYDQVVKSPSLYLVLVNVKYLVVSKITLG